MKNKKAILAWQKMVTVMLRVDRASTGFNGLQRASTSHHATPHGRNELNKLTSLPTCGFMAQLVEHHTGIAEVTGSNPVEALIFFRLLLSSCLNWKINCGDHSSLSEIRKLIKKSR